jgi:hypothetical protein
MRIPHAARTLAKDLGARYKNVPHTPDGDPDGLGVHRSVRYTGAAGKFLAKIADALADDPRIVGSEKHKDGVVIHFTDRITADSRDPFPLDAAEAVSEGSESESDPED